MLVQEGSPLGGITASYLGRMNIVWNAEKDLITSLRALSPFYLFIYIYWLCLASYRFLVHQPGIEPGPSAVEAQSRNHWTAREVPALSILDGISISAFFLQCSIFELHSCVMSRSHLYILVHCQAAFHCMKISRFDCPFSGWRIVGMFPVLFYCEQSHCGHSHVCLSVDALTTSLRSLLGGGNAGLYSMWPGCLTYAAHCAPNSPAGESYYPISQSGKLRLRENEWLKWGDLAGKGLSWNPDPQLGDLSLS